MPQLQTFAPGNLYSHFRPALAENHAQDARISNTHRIPDEHSPAALVPRLPTVPQNRVVFFDKSVKKGLLHAMALISRRTLPAAGLPASWQLQHHRILSIWCFAETIKRRPSAALFGVLTLISSRMALI
jgi:hypothetical protein